MRQNHPQLSGFKLLDLEDKKAINPLLEADPPRISELTFTNLFIWRHHYRPCWRVYKKCLLVVFHPADGKEPFGLPPQGPGDKAAALDFLMQDMDQAGLRPRICRAGTDFVQNQLHTGRYEATLDPANSDYVYLTDELISLSGRKFHQKKNHLNKFLKNYPFEYRKLDEALVESVLSLQDAWCELKNCEENPSLLDEDHAIFEALRHFGDLDFIGGVILIQGKVEAFSLGEALSPNTAVIHIEKANPEIAGLYAAINQQFCQHAWADMEFVNREQDLGLEGLRAAKQSYNPHHMEEKYIVRPAGRG